MYKSTELSYFLLSLAWSYVCIFLDEPSPLIKRLSRWVSRHAARILVLQPNLNFQARHSRQSVAKDCLLWYDSSNWMSELSRKMEIVKLKNTQCTFKCLHANMPLLHLETCHLRNIHLSTTRLRNKLIKNPCPILIKELVVPAKIEQACLAEKCFQAVP